MGGASALMGGGGGGVKKMMGWGAKTLPSKTSREEDNISVKVREGSKIETSKYGTMR